MDKKVFIVKEVKLINVIKTRGVHRSLPEESKRLLLVSQNKFNILLLSWLSLTLSYVKSLRKILLRDLPYKPLFSLSIFYLNELVGQALLALKQIPGALGTIIIRPLKKTHKHN